MSTLDHPNVLTLMGVCLDGGPTPFIVMPFMFNGSLLSYLKKERDNLILPPEREADSTTVSFILSALYIGRTQGLILQVTTSIRLMEMSMQVAKGMEYLASERLVHRDLAARNCM